MSKHDAELLLNRQATRSLSPHHTLPRRLRRRLAGAVTFAEPVACRVRRRVAGLVRADPTPVTVPVGHLLVVRVGYAGPRHNHGLPAVRGFCWTRHRTLSQAVPVWIQA
jgi:hypothetical protein